MGSPYQESPGKIPAQTMALTRVTASTWGATVNKARPVYTAMVRPAMKYGAPVWHSLEETRTRGLGPAAKRTSLLNQCLRSITGAYEARNVKVLEAESGVMPPDTCLDQTVLRSRNTPRCAEVINPAKETMRRKLRGKRGRQPGNTYSNGSEECMG